MKPEYVVSHMIGVGIERYLRTAIEASDYYKDKIQTHHLYWTAMVEFCLMVKAWMEGEMRDEICDMLDMTDLIKILDVTKGLAQQVRQLEAEKLRLNNRILELTIHLSGDKDAEAEPKMF